jgi:predicted enzyme related to lactoylglutathione lyase
MATKLNARLVGVEFYFENLEKAKRFYSETLGLAIQDEEPGRYAKYAIQPAFVCLERKGSESYRSHDKAVLFLEVPNLPEAINAIGREQILEVKTEGEDKRRPWAVLHDPEGYNIVLLEAGKDLAFT